MQWITVWFDGKIIILTFYFKFRQVALFYQNHIAFTAYLQDLNLPDGAVCLGLLALRTGKTL